LRGSYCCLRRALVGRAVGARAGVGEGEKIGDVPVELLAQLVGEVGADTTDEGVLVGGEPRSGCVVVGV